MKKDWGIALCLSIVALLVRLPFRARYLQHWDSVNFAFSLEHYDVRLHQPHPPGYFLYSLLGKLVNLLTQDANAALVVISLVSGALGIGVLYLLALQLTRRNTAVVVALLGLTSPLHWFESDVALTYSLEFLLISLSALFFFLQRNGKKELWFWSSLLFGIAAGVRLQDLFFLGPLWLLSLQPLSWKRRIWSGLVLACVLLASILPMMALSGGLSGYMAATMGQTVDVSSGSAFSQIKDVGVNFLRLALYLVYGLMAAGVFLLIGVPQSLRRWKLIWKDWRFLFFGLWIVPAFLFFVGYIRQSGHVMVILPALLILAGWGLMDWVERSGRIKLGFALVVIACGINVTFFLIAPQGLLGSNRVPLLTPSRASIVERDQLLESRISAISEKFNPGRTVVIAGGFFIRTADYYLRNFQATDLSYRLPDEPTPLANGVDTLVLFDDLVFPGISSNYLKIETLQDGSSMRYFQWNSDEQLWISQAGIEIRER